MKLPIGCPIWNPLKHGYYRFLSIHVYSILPKIGRQCTPPRNEELDIGQSDILVLADVPPRNEKVGYRSKWHFGSGWCTPQEWKVGYSQSDILVRADVFPPPRSENVGHRWKWHFGSGWCTPLPEIEIGLNMNAIGKKSFQEMSSSTFYQSTPPPFHTIIWFYAWTGNWWISISNG